MSTIPSTHSTIRAVATRNTTLVRGPEAHCGQQTYQCEQRERGAQRQALYSAPSAYGPGQIELLTHAPQGVTEPLTK